MTTVVVTRPVAQADALAERLAEAGFEPLIYPAIAIAPAADPAPLREALARLERYQLVIFVSPNAIHHALTSGLARRPEVWPIVLPMGVMGPGSVAALADCGIDPQTHTIYSPQAAQYEPSNQARFDSESLLKQLDINALRGSRVLIIKGNGGRPWLAERLVELGIEVEQVESYRRSRHQPDAEQQAAIRQAMAASKTDESVRPTWIVTSSEAITYLFASLDEMGGPDAVAWLKSCRWLVPHPRIAENATTAGVRHVVLSGAGDANIVQALK